MGTRGGLSCLRACVRLCVRGGNVSCSHTAAARVLASSFAMPEPTTVLSLIRIHPPSAASRSRTSRGCGARRCARIWARRRATTPVSAARPPVSQPLGASVACAAATALPDPAPMPPL